MKLQSRSLTSYNICDDWLSTGLLYFSKVPNQVPLKARLWQGWPLSSAWQDFEHQSLGSKTHCAPNKVFYWPWKWPSAKRTGVAPTIDQSLKTTKKDWAKILRTSAFDGERQLWGQADQFLRRFVVRIQLKEYYWVAFFNRSKYFCNNTKS